jgi:hypothetical protein
MTNSGMIAAMGSVAAAVFFLAGIVAVRFIPGKGGEVLLVAGLLLSAVYLFVSLFWGVRATSLESFEVTKKKKE